MDLERRKTWSLKDADIELPDSFKSFSFPTVLQHLQTLAPTSHSVSAKYVLLTIYNISSPISPNNTFRFYKLLIYEPGDFFIPHVDSQYSLEQFATLSIHLPFPHTGGSLEIGIDENIHTVDFSQDQTPFRYVAWLNNVMHQVLPVTSGYRIVLIYLIHRERKVQEISLQSYQHENSILFRNETTSSRFIAKKNRIFMFFLFRYNDLSSLVHTLAYSLFPGKQKPLGLVIFLANMYSKTSLEKNTESSPIFRGKDAILYQLFKSLGLECQPRFVIELVKVDLYRPKNVISTFQKADCWVGFEPERVNSTKHWGCDTQKPNMFTPNTLFLKAIMKDGTN